MNQKNHRKVIVFSKIPIIRLKSAKVIYFFDFVCLFQATASIHLPEVRKRGYYVNRRSSIEEFP